MSKKLYAGNLSFSTDENSLKSAFEPFGQVLSATVILDRATGRSKGFGFVEFDDEADCAKAIAVLNGRELDGRKIRVSYAEEKKPFTR